jgi:ribulose-phosphate 3-epimerase
MLTRPPIRIAPSILAADFTRLGDHIRQAEAAGADWIHVDVMDGHFVPSLSFGAIVVEAARRVTALPLDIHIMVREPDHLLEGFAKAGASAITVHVEACTHLHRSLQSIRALGCKTGVALNPATPAASLTEVLPLVDLLLVMTVNPGYGGQKFLPETLGKIRQVRAWLDERGLATDISVDGGISPETAPQVVNAGANVLVAGTAVFNPAFSVEQGLAQVREAAERSRMGMA